MKPRPDPKVDQWLDQVEDERLFISVISLAEIFKGIYKLPQNRRRREIQEWLDQKLLPWFAGRLLPVDEIIAGQLGRWTGEALAKGLNINMADGLIAATALRHDLTLVTRNVKDFTTFGVPILNPWEL